MSSDNDDNRKGIAALFPWLVTAGTVAVLGIALISGGGDSTPAAVADQPPTTTAAATTTAPATTPEDTSTETDAGDEAAIPEEVASDPIVKRLARGRTLPFTAGPWKREVWRDAVYERLRPATQERAEKVEQDGGFGILIQ